MQEKLFQGATCQYLSGITQISKKPFPAFKAREKLFTASHLELKEV